MPSIDWVTETTDGETPKIGQFETRTGIVDGEKRFTVSFSESVWTATDAFCKTVFISPDYGICVYWCWNQLIDKMSIGEK